MKPFSVRTDLSMDFYYVRMLDHFGDFYLNIVRPGFNQFKYLNSNNPFEDLGLPLKILWLGDLKWRFIKNIRYQTRLVYPYKRWKKRDPVRLNQPYGERFWLLPFKHWQLAILRAPHYALYGAGDFFYTLHTLIRPFARFSEKDSSRPWDIALYKCRNYIKLVHFVFRASDPLLTFAWKAKFGNRSPLYYTLSKDYSSALDLNSNSFVLKPSFFIASLAKLFFQHIKHIIYLILTLLFVLLFSYTPHIAGDRRRFEAIKFKEYVRLEQEAYDQKRYKLRYLREAIEAFKRQKLAAKNRARNRSPVRFKTVVKKIRQTSRNLRKLLRRDITGIYKRERKWLFVQSLKMGRKLRRQVFQQIEREKRRKREDEERLKKRGIKLESESVNIPETCITAAVLVTPEELKKRAKLQKKKK